MVKKLAAICLITVLSLLLLPFAASAEQATITSPENGTVVLPSFSEISANLPSGIEKAVLYIDGERVFETTETALFYTLENYLSIGFHEVAVVTISESGAEKAVSNFEVETSTVKEHMSMDMASAPDIPDFSKVGASVKDADGESHAIAFKKVAGREGDGDAATAFYCPVDAPAVSNNINPSYYSNASPSFGFPWTGKLDFQMDMYFSHTLDFGFETKNPTTYGFFFAETLFTKSGTIASSGGKTYPLGEWFRIKILIDMETLDASMDIGTYEEDGSIICYIKLYS